MRYKGMKTTEEIIAERRAMLYNIKVKNVDKSIFGNNKAREKELMIERDKLNVVLNNKESKINLLKIKGRKNEI